MKHLAPRNHKGSQLQKGPFTTNFSTTKTSTNFHTLPEAGLRKSIFCTHRVGKMKVLLALAAVVCVADAFVRMPGLRPAATQMRGWPPPHPVPPFFASMFSISTLAEVERIPALGSSLSPILEESNARVPGRGNHCFHIRPHFLARNLGLDSA
jgi:hypothetical protein